MVLWLAKVTPDIHLFAHAHNKKLEKFVPRKPCIGTFHVDAFTLKWHDLPAFVFPPFPCISSAIKSVWMTKYQEPVGYSPFGKQKVDGQA